MDPRWPLAALLIAGGCGHGGDAAAVALEANPSPARVGSEALTVRLSLHGKPIAGASVTLEANMAHPGMAPSFGKAIEVSPGLYRAGLELSMRGDWVVLVHGTLADGSKIEKEVKLPGVQ